MPPLLKKEVAALAGIAPRTMRRNQKDWDWLEECRTRRAGRPTYNNRRVMAELRKRNII